MRIFNNILALTRKSISNRNTIKRFFYEYNFDSSEEILENYLNKVMLIGINLPDTKNMLSETAIEKLCEVINKFYINDEVSVAVLHGCGGNFCSGVVSTPKAKEISVKLIDVLHNGKKPIIGALNGQIMNFGFQLAVMCDLRSMEIASLAGLGDKNERLEIPVAVVESLVSSVGLLKTKQMVFTNCKWTAEESLKMGFVNELVSTGAALGVAVVWAQSTALSPLKTILEEKHKFNCLLKNRN